LAQGLGLEFQQKRERLCSPKSKSVYFVGYSEDSKGYKLINLSTNKAFIERCDQFQEEPLAAVEVGETSSPPEPLKVSEEFVENADSDMYGSDEFIAYPNSPTRQKWQPRHYMQQES